MMLSETSRTKINSEISKYPQGHARAAVMAALTIGQQELGWVSPDLMEHIAEILDIEPIKVAEVATFYTMYDLEPTGRHKISVCTNISCTLQGCMEIVNHLFKNWESDLVKPPKTVDIHWCKWSVWQRVLVRQLQ